MIHHVAEANFSDCWVFTLTPVLILLIRVGWTAYVCCSYFPERRTNYEDYVGRVLLEVVGGVVGVWLLPLPATHEVKIHLLLVLVSALHQSTLRAKYFTLRRAGP